MRLTAWNIVLLLSLSCLQASFADNENDRRHKYGNGLNNDGAAYIGDQKTKQQLTPNMMSHYAQAQMHFAMGNIPMGTMEQTKGDLLKQQIQENKKSADKNRESEKLLYDFTEKKVDPSNAADTKVLTVDKDRLGPSTNQNAESPVNELPPPPAKAAPISLPGPKDERSPLAAEQIATMGPSQKNFVREPASAPQIATDAITEPAKVAPVFEPSSQVTADSKPDWKRDLEGLAKSDPAAPKAVLPDLPSPDAIQGRLLGTANDVANAKAEKDFFSKVGKEEPKADDRKSSRRAKSPRTAKKR